MNTATKMIKRVGGPFGGTTTEDHYAKEARYGLRRPRADGETETGDSVYRANAARTETRWVEDRWEGLTMLKKRTA